MNILLSMHADPDVNSGVGGVTIRLADMLRRRGHLVDLLSFADLRGSAISKQIRFPWHVAAELARRPRYDVLDMTSGDGWVFKLAHDLRHAGSRPLFVTRSHGLEHIVHAAALGDARARGEKLSWKYPLYHGGFRLWECAMSFRRADIALFLNEPDRSFAIEHLRVRPERAIKIRNGIGAPFIAAATRHTECPEPPETPQKIAFIGTYQARKGIAYLHQAALGLLRDFPDLVIGYFGAGTPASEIQQTYPAHVRGRIFVQETYRNEDLPALLEGYGILAFPSLAEGFPLAPVEAMACGLVPVVSAIPGPLEYVSDGRNGFAVPPADAAGLEDRLRQLLNDHGLWSRLRQAALETALQHSWETITDHLEAVYDQGLRQTTLVTHRKISAVRL